MFFRKGNSIRAHEILTDLRRRFEKYDMPIWRQKCDREFEPYHF